MPTPKGKGKKADVTVTVTAPGAVAIRGKGTVGFAVRDIVFDVGTGAKSITLRLVD